MDGENNGNPLLKWMIWGTTIFGNIQVYQSLIDVDCHILYLVKLFLLSLVRVQPELSRLVNAPFFFGSSMAPLRRIQRSNEVGDVHWHLFDLGVVEPDRCFLEVFLCFSSTNGIGKVSHIGIDESAHMHGNVDVK